MISVLVVEEDRDDRDGLAAAFERAGYRVLVPRQASDAFGALRAAGSLPSAVVVDWTMPLLQGLDFLTAQAADPRLREVPVIVIADLGRMDRVPSLGVDAVVAKPVRMRTIVDVVNRLCGLTQRFDARGPHARARIGGDHRCPPTAMELPDTTPICRPRVEPEPCQTRKACHG